MGKTRMREIWDAVADEVWFAECKSSVIPLEGMEWDVFQCEIMHGGDPLGAAYGETKEEARGRAEAFVRALGFKVPERVDMREESA